MRNMEGLALNLQPLTDDSVSGHSQRREVTQNQRLIQRIKKDFTRKALIGDILINDQEYDRLVEYFKIKCQYTIRSGRPIDADPVFATALVQIGIRYYNGNLWGNVAQILGRPSITANHQRSIGESFVATLQYYNKKMLDRREWVNNILLHGFVSNHYTFDLFEFLFRFYNLDLERDLDRNTAEMMDSLMEIAQRDDNTGRTYLLVKHTANALAVNSKGGKIRIRRLLRMIDRAFWEQITPTNPVSRLSILFNEWIKQSDEFQLQYNRLQASGGSQKGRKSFSSPYLYCDYHHTAFKIKLPTQLIRADDPKSVIWRICIGDQPPMLVETEVYPAVTGFKTEEHEIPLSSDDLFEQIELELLRDGERIRLFKIQSDCIRFFDSSGNFLLTDNNLPINKVYAFTKLYETPISDALIENEPVKGLVRSYFEFEIGDIIRLPDGHVISIGKNIEEGLLYRKRLSGVICSDEGVEVPIFSRPPSILLKINEKRANGTLIIINGKHYRLFDAEVTKIELTDRTGETGYLINLGKHGCVQNGMYQVYIDVPNDRTNRSWQFVLMKEFTYEFEEAPYIFQTRGTIRFAKHFLFKSIDSFVQKNIDENSYNFEIIPEQNTLRFEYKAGDQELILHFDIPALQWKCDEGAWQVEKPGDLWYTELPQFIYLKYPEDGISFSMDEEGWEHEDVQEQRINFKSSKLKHTFECDMTRVHSWLGREQILRLGFLELSNRRVEFLRIITKSVVVSCLLKGDFQKNMILGELTIVGKSNYFVDLWKTDTNELLAEKLPLHDGLFSIPYHSGSGLFKVNIFEDEEDDTGFGLSNYFFVESIKQSLTNPFDLRGKSLRIRCVKKGINSLFHMSFSGTYVIRHLERKLDKNRNLYSGKLFILSSPLPPIDVTLEFPNLNQLQYAYLQFFDGYDDVEFLYDHHRKFLVKSEQRGLSRSVKYRRYESLFPEDYVYMMDFID